MYNRSAYNAQSLAALKAAISIRDGYAEPASDTLTVNQCAGGQINNIGQGANDVDLTLPAAAAGMSFRAVVGEPSANAWKFTAAVAGTMIVDGAYGKDYAQFETPGLGNYFDAFTMESVPQPVGMLTAAALAIGSTKTNVYSAAFTYYIAGVKYAKTEVAAGTAPGNDVIPQNKYGAIAFDIGADGTIDAVEATDNAAGYDSQFLAVAGLPAVEAAHVRIGYVTAIGSEAAFIFGTTELDAENTTVAYTSTAAYTPGYNWVVKTGAGTVTTS